MRPTRTSSRTSTTRSPRSVPSRSAASAKVCSRSPDPIRSGVDARLSSVSPTRCRRFSVRAALVVVSATAVAACSSDRGTLTAPSFGVPASSVPDASGPGDVAGDLETVVMVGDSITVGSEEPLNEGFVALGLDVRAIDAASGRRITVDGGEANSGLSAVGDLTGDTPDLWVIALGTNDVSQYDGEQAYRDQIASLLVSLPDDAPVVWVDTYLAEDPERSAEFNQALRDTLAFRGTATVADWATVAAGDGVLRDGIHPSEEGAQMFADVVMGAVEPWLEG